MTMKSATHYQKNGPLYENVDENFIKFQLYLILFLNSFK